MCISCWEEYGSPCIVNDAVLRARAAVTALYGDHDTGGGLHIVTDDWNLDDDDVGFCREWMQKHGADDLERAALAAIEPLTKAERASALALERGYFAP